MNPFQLLKTLIFKNSPVYVHYGITHRCNLQCRMCGIWKTAPLYRELEIEQIDGMAAAFSRLGVQAVSIGGGEPLLREDLPDAVSCFARRGISVRVLTNGVTADEKMMESLVSAGANGFSVSLDTTDADLQDSITGLKGGFEKAVETIGILSKLLSEKKGLGLVNTVVSPANIDHLPDMVDLAEKSGFYVSFVPLEVHRQGCGGAGDSAFNFTVDMAGRIRKSYDALIKLKKEGKPIFNSSWFLEISKEHLSGNFRPWGCRAGELYFSVDPSGVFSMCHGFTGFNDGKTLSVTDGNFVDEYEKARKSGVFAEKSKNCTGCVRPCWAEVCGTFSRTGPLWQMSAIHFNTKTRKFL